MRLSSTDIRDLLEKGCLDISSDLKHPFNPDTQIRPGSIDLRISNKFWKFKVETIKCLDLANTDLSKAIKENPEFMYEKIELEESIFIEINPKEILLTETLENLKIPDFLSGSLKGRSSFARLGISIHCTGDYINPGYQGHMPIQIVNNSPIPIKIYPYLSIAQLVLYFLYSEPDISYQSLPNTIYNSERCNTQGLSLWYRDQKIDDLAYKITGKRFSRNAEEKIRNIVLKAEKRTLKQVEEDLKRKKIDQSSDIEKELDIYENKDVKRDKKMRLAFWITTLITGATVSVIIPELIKVILNNEPQNPIFWFSLVTLIFCIFVLWITFDYKYIGL
jgi:deoxycytidine triphosphate deaminase